MAGHRALLLLLLAAALVAALVTVASAEDAKPSILTPVANTPLGSFEGESPSSDDAMDDDDAAPVGSPTGATMTEPKPELPSPPGAGGEAGGATSGASVLGVVAACVGAVAAVAASAFAL